MITIYNVKKSDIEGDGKFLVELRGLSDDEKPTTINGGEILNGSSFIEIDTGDIYLYDGENTEWYNVTSSNENEESEETPAEEQGD